LGSRAGVAGAAGALGWADAIEAVGWGDTIEAEGVIIALVNVDSPSPS